MFVLFLFSFFAPDMFLFLLVLGFCYFISTFLFRCRHFLPLISL